MKFRADADGDTAVGASARVVVGLRQLLPARATRRGLHASPAVCFLLPCMGKGATAAGIAATAVININNS